MAIDVPLYRDGERVVVGRLTPARRECWYCKTQQFDSVECTHCGAPDDGKRGPLEMAPMNVVMA